MPKRAYPRPRFTNNEVVPFKQPKETIVEQTRGMFKSVLSKIGLPLKEPSEADLLNKRKASSEHGSRFKYNTPFKEGDVLNNMDLDRSYDYVHVETEDGAKTVLTKTALLSRRGNHRPFGVTHSYRLEELLTDDEKKSGRKPSTRQSIKLGDTITINGEQKKIKSIIVTHDVGEDFRKRAEAESPAKPQMNQAV